jgi:phage tail sheath protein FI
MSAPGPAVAVRSGVPGILRQDVPPERSADQSSGVCALLGVAGEGPFYTPVALRRADQWATAFGAAVPGAHLAAAVQGFFACGGTACYVVRVDLGDDDWLARGLAALAPLDDADLIAVPDLPASPADRRVALQRAVLEHCARAGTRFAVLDAAPGATAAEAIADRAGLSSRFGALYFPWVRLADGSVVPPCGHVAGVYAAGDADRGVGAAPANRELAGVFDLVPLPTPADLAELTAAGVNPLRSLPGRGLRVWGARTLAGADQPEWSAIGVSRLFLAVARWLSAIGPALTFEPNDLALWVRVRRQLTERLWQLWRRGDLAGASPDEAFYVTCDAGTNPPELRDAGLLVTEIGLAPTVPAEFVVVRLVQQGADVTVH